MIKQHKLKYKNIKYKKIYNLVVISREGKKRKVLKF